MINLLLQKIRARQITTAFFLKCNIRKLVSFSYSCMQSIQPRVTKKPNFLGGLYLSLVNDYLKNKEYRVKLSLSFLFCVNSNPRRVLCQKCFNN